MNATMAPVHGLATAVISPLGTALLLGLAALVLGALRWRRLSVAAALLGLVWLWVWSMPVASLWLRGALEHRYPPVALQGLPSAQAIVVLGGGMSPPGAGRPWPDLSAAADRVWHASRLFHAGKAPIVLMSGGADPAISPVSEAQSMRDFIVDLGVPNAAVLLEASSRNSRENAQFTAVLLRQRQIDRVLLVTSALHMRRALAHFRAEGLTVVPAATDHSPLDAPGIAGWLPDAGALEGSGRAFKELIGQWIWLTARD